MNHLGSNGVRAICTENCAIPARRGAARRMVSGIALAWILTALPSASWAQSTPPILPLSEVRAGQRGEGLSVWTGSTPETFQAEVLGVLRNTSPDNSFILARLSGMDLERSGVIAGMSGSPVYIDGKLIGAVAFSFLYAQDAIAGITPIEAMRRLAKLPAGTRTPAPPPANIVPIAEQVRALASGESSKEALRQRLATLRPAFAAMGNDTTSGLLFAASGFGDTSQGLLREALGGLAAAGDAASYGAADSGAPSGGTATASAELAPGSAVAGILVDGDLRLAVTGTVTDRVGDQVLAFGHPFLGSGPMLLPMAPAQVITVVSSRMNSFKLANFGAPVGAFDQDRAPGVRGRIGLVAPTVPLTVTVGERTFHMRLADVPVLLPQMLAVSELGSLDAAGHAGGSQSLTLEAVFDLAGHPDLRIVQDFDSGNAGIESALYLLSLGSFLTQNRLEDVGLESIKLTVQVREGEQAALLLGAHADHALVRPGDTVAIDLDLQAFRGAPMRHSVSVTVPKDLANGRYSLIVGDGPSVDAARLGFENASPETFAQVLEILNTLHSRRDLVVLGFSAAKGLEVSGQAMPRLPGSMRAVWGAAGSWSVMPLRFAVAQQEVERMNVPISGAARIDLEVRRLEPVDASGRPRRARPPTPPAAGAKAGERGNSRGNGS